jgi:sugar lactone lactonase YvrE
MSEAPKQQLVINGLAFAEAPRWHIGKLWFSDMYTHSVHCLEPGGQLTTVAEVPGRPSGWAGCWALMCLAARRSSRRRW